MDQQDKKNEEIFLKNLEKVKLLDKHITQMSEAYDIGVTELAFERYKNEHLNVSLSSSTYQPAPAVQILKTENNKLKLNKIGNKKATYLLEKCKDNTEKEKNSLFIDEDEVKQQEKWDKEYQESCLKEFQNIENYDVLNNFGQDQSDSMGVKRARNQFQKSLEAIIEIANIIREIKEQNQKNKKQK